MPLIFIHGVNNRMAPGYQESVAARDALFRRFTLAALTKAPEHATVLNPYWGDQGASFRWGLACLPGEGDAESLGAADADPQMVALAAAAAATAGSAAAADHPLLAAARADFPTAVDLVFAAAAVEARADEAAGLAELAARAAAYADAHPRPPDWLADVADDDALLDRLAAEIDATTPTNEAAAAPAAGYEALGLADVWSAVRGGADRLGDAASDVVGSKVYAAVRRHVAPTVATFFGDVFEYLAHRGTADCPGPVPAIVIDALRAGRAAVTADDPQLVVVGHSLGGVIGYDLLSSFVPDLPVDAFVTVGNQVGLFEELKLFRGSDSDIPGGGVTKIQMPQQVAHWINVFDTNDLLSYRLAPLVNGVEEFRYATGELLTAHGAYFGQPRFHQRLAERLRAALTP